MCSAFLACAQSVVDPPLECVDPGDQRIEFPGVDFLLEPSDLVIQITQVLKDVFRPASVSTTCCEAEWIA